MESPGLVIQNQPSAPLGLAEGWLRGRGIDVEMQRTWSDGDWIPPDPVGYRFLVVLGCARSVLDRDVPWIPRSIDLIAGALEAEVPVFGICFGAQALATALGGEVIRMPEPEVSWQELAVDDDVVPSGPWLVWHRDAFTIPPSAIELAHSDRASLAFRSGPHLGVQFHPEATPELVDGWAEEEVADLARDGIDIEVIQREAPRRAALAAAAAMDLFERWWSRCVEHGEGR